MEKFLVVKRKRLTSSEEHSENRKSGLSGSSATMLLVQRSSSSGAEHRYQESYLSSDLHIPNLEIVNFLCVLYAAKN
jgi:hypothetical protein